MRHIVRLFLAVLFFVLVLVLVFCPKTAIAEDPVRVAPDGNKLLLKNDRERVLGAQPKPGEKAMHAHPDHIVYSLSSGIVLPS